MKTRQLKFRRREREGEKGHMMDVLLKIMEKKGSVVDLGQMIWWRVIEKKESERKNALHSFCLFFKWYFSPFRVETIFYDSERYKNILIETSDQPSSSPGSVRLYISSSLFYWPMSNHSIDYWDVTTRWHIGSGQHWPIESHRRDLLSVDTIFPNFSIVR